jgi:L-rhamnose mutarotase
MKSTFLKIATLHADQIEHYQRLHDQIPFENRLGLFEGGYVNVSIFLFKNTLVMQGEIDDSMVQTPSLAAIQAAATWKEQTDPLFATPWADLTQIFEFDAAVFKGTQSHE